MIVQNNRILEILLEADADPNDPQKQPNEKPDKPEGFEEDPMGFIIRKYEGLNVALTELMSKDYKQYLTAIFLVAPKPTTFKIVLHNGQYFFMTYMGKKIAGTNETDSHVYEANIAGKRFYLDNIGIKERAMNAITRLLKFGAPLKTKGPEGAEESTRPEGENEIGGGEETGGGEENAGTEESLGSAGAEALKESNTKINILRSLLSVTNKQFSTLNQKLINVLIKEVTSNNKNTDIKEKIEKTVTLFKAIQKIIGDSGFKVGIENKGTRGPVLRADLKTSGDVQSALEKVVEELLPKGTFKISEFEKNQGESKSSTYPTYKIELVKATDAYKKGESVFVVNTMKKGATTKGKALTPNKLGLTSGEFKNANNLASTIKKNIPNATNNPKLQELLNSLVDDVLKGAVKGKFADVSEITRYNENIQLSERSKAAISQVSPQDLGMIGSDFGECLGAIVLLKSVTNPGSGISFPADEANPLADFLLDGYNVSSKYNKGGAASITDTIKNIKEEQLTTPGQRSLYKIFKIILEYNAIEGPINVAKALKLDSLEKLSQIIKVPSKEINRQNINDYVVKLLKSATTDEQKDAIIKKKFGSFFSLIKKTPDFPLKWRDLSPKNYYGIITAPFNNHVAASLNANKTYKKALTDIMSKTEVKQLYLKFNVKQNVANFNLKSFSSSEFEFDSALSAYSPGQKKLAFRVH